MNKRIALIALTLASMALIAEEDLIAKLDTDNDGLISIEEAVKDADLSEQFAEIDKNSDGYISPNELERNAIGDLE